MVVGAGGIPTVIKLGEYQPGGLRREPMMDSPAPIVSHGFAGWSATVVGEDVNARQAAHVAGRCVPMARPYFVGLFRVF